MMKSLLLGLKKALPAAFLFLGLVAFTTVQATNVTVFNDTKCKYVVHVVYGASLAVCGPDLVTVIVNVPAMSTVVVPSPGPGLFMIKGAAWENSSPLECAVYDPVCNTQQLCGPFGGCDAYLGWSSSTVLKIFQ